MSRKQFYDNDEPLAVDDGPDFRAAHSPPRPKPRQWSRSQMRRFWLSKPKGDPFVGLYGLAPIEQEPVEISMVTRCRSGALQLRWFLRPRDGRPGKPSPILEYRDDHQGD